MKKLQFALMKDNCTFKESLTLDLKPPLESVTSIALNFGPRIGKKATLSAKLTSSNDMKSACNGMKQMELNILNSFQLFLSMNMNSATMKILIEIERSLNAIFGTRLGRNSVSVRMT